MYRMLAEQRPHKNGAPHGDKDTLLQRANMPTIIEVVP